MFKDIKIGTMVHGTDTILEYVRQTIPYGFESIAISFGDKMEFDLQEYAGALMPLLKEHGITVEAISLYGNPLLDTDKAAAQREMLAKLIDGAKYFETDIVSGFTGRLVHQPIDASIQRFAEVWSPLAKRAADNGVRIAFENCPMGGSWQDTSNQQQYGDPVNIACMPAAWELMFEALPDANVGLEWEPTHQMVQLIDPMANLRKYVKRIFHLHGKDATIMRDVIASDGINGPRPWCYHRHPGFGDCNWKDIITELRLAGFKGAIDIEGWHDPVYRGELEMTGQVYALNYLKSCRGGDFIPNPVV